MYLPFGLDTPAKVYSLWYQRYMHTYGITNDDFGLYAVVARKHAATNPNAFYYQQPLTLEEHQQSRWIVEPILRKLDCCQESDGGVALVVTSMDRAKDLPHEPVRVAAASQGHLRDGDEMFGYYRGDRAGYEEGASLGQAALRGHRARTRRHRRGDDLRELHAHRVHPARGVRVLRSAAKPPTSSPAATSRSAARPR